MPSPRLRNRLDLSFCPRLAVTAFALWSSFLPVVWPFAQTAKIRDGV